MSPFFHSHRAFWQRLGILLGACTVALLAPSTGRAQESVESLRKELQRISDEPKPTPEFLNDRSKLIKASIDEMKTIGHYRRAFMLKEWPLDPKLGVDQHRARIGALFTKAVKDAADDPDESRRLAVAFLIAELADSDQPSEKGKGKFARRFDKVAIKLATDEKINVRRAGLHAIGKITPEPGVVLPTLKNALAKEEVALRRLAAYALTDLVKNAQYLRISDEAKEKKEPNEELHTIDQVVAAAAAALSDADEQVRGYCLQTILESARALNDYLDSTIAYPLPQVLDADLKATFDTLKKSNAPVLQTLRDTESIKVRLTALLALDQVGIARATVLKRLREQPAEKRPTSSQLFDAAKVADPFHNMVKGEWRLLAALLSDGDVRLRRGAIDLLEQLGDELAPAEPEIARALRDSDRLVRWSAARTIRLIPAKEVSGKAVAALAKMLQDDDPDLIATAAVTIMVTKDFQGLGAHAAAAVDALEKSERDAALDAFAFAVTNGGRGSESRRDAESRLLGMRVLISMGGSPAYHAIPNLIDALTDPEARIRRTAAETLGTFGPAAKDALPALRAALRDENGEVRLLAGEAILSIDPPKKGL